VPSINHTGSDAMIVGPVAAERVDVRKRRSIRVLYRRVSVAPMMNWTDAR